MKIACYCQHVLGIGHFHRSLSICEELARQHDTVMILGGPDVPMPETAVRFFSLPGLKMNDTFSTLLPCREGADVEQIKEQRTTQLFSFLQDFRPDVFLVELYPFGRKAFRFELDPVLSEMKSGVLSPCLRICSLRDILVEKKKKEKYEKRVITTLSSLFDRVLVHSDPDFISLAHTFSKTEEISIPLHYTGFISATRNKDKQPNKIRQELHLSAGDKLIVGSIGGGSVGAELLHAVTDAAHFLGDPKLHFHLFCGPYSDPDLLKTLRAKNAPHTTIHPFADNFPQWLEAADLSISMAGYNTCMNILAAGVPALLYPFAQNREQGMRIAAFSRSAAMKPLHSKDLAPKQLSQKIINMLQLAKRRNTVNVDGAKETASLLNSFLP